MGSNTIFTGSSSYSQDFIDVIERSMAIARLPLLQMQQQRIEANDRQAALTSLQGSFGSLRLAVEDVSARVASTQLSASFSESGIATATIGEQASKGTFSLEVLSLGNQTSFLSAATANDPATDGLGTELTKTLVVDGVETVLNLESNTLSALANAINEAGAGLNASVINVSSTATPSYRLVLQGDKYAAQAMTLHDGDAMGTNLLDASALQSGQGVSYRVNGVAVSSESRSVTLAPGVDVRLTGVSAGAVTLTVSRSAADVSGALQSMVAAYNQVTAKLNEHRGTAGGALQGSPTVQNLGQLLRKVNSFTGTDGAFLAATDIGLSFNEQGVLSLETAKLVGLSEGQLDELLAFLGNADEGGFLGAASDLLKQATSEEFGILTAERDAMRTRIANTDRQISAMEERLQRSEQDLRDRFARVDSTIAALQQQARFINGMFEAMRVSMRAYSG
jgi:flagellar hook-associated protein 2